MLRKNNSSMEFNTNIQKICVEKLFFQGILILLLLKEA